MGDERSPRFQHGGQYIDVGEQRDLGGGRRNRLAGKPTCSPEAVGGFSPYLGCPACETRETDYYYSTTTVTPAFRSTLFPRCLLLHACADLTWHGLARSARESNPWAARASEFNLTSLHYYGELCAAAAEASGHSKKRSQRSCRARDRGRARRTSSVPASLHSSG